MVEIGGGVWGGTGVLLGAKGGFGLWPPSSSISLSLGKFLSIKSRSSVVTGTLLLMSPKLRDM